jgi:hypothetical protein
MKQRSAMVVAAGLVLALALAGLGLAMGMTGPSADAKAPKPQHRPPIVHTTKRTITVHKPATAPAAGSNVAVTSTGTAAAPTTATYEDSSSTDDSYEPESESSDDSYEGSPTGGFEGGDD